jgi:streptomycin 3"-kinase
VALHHADAGRRVLDWREASGGACLVTKAVPGVRADQLDVLELRRAWPSIAAQVKGIHSLPTDQCPFDRGLGWMTSRARDTVREGRVVVDYLPAEVSALIDLGRLGTADQYGDIALLLSTAREVWSDEATAARADQQFSEVYGTDLDPVRHDFYLRLDPLTW